MYKNNKQGFSLKNDFQKERDFFLINGLQRGRQGFSLIELIVVIAIIGALVMLASPRFLGRTKEATLAKHLYNVRTLEDTMDRYALENDRFPRLSEEAYTSEEIEEYANRIRDLTGEEVTLDPEGKYYDIDYVTLRDYVKVPDKRDMPNYILQNPVGKVFFLEELTEIANERVDFTISNPMNNKTNRGKQPIAVISGLPNSAITKDTKLDFGFENSKTINGKEIMETEWENKKDFYELGEHTVSLRVQDSAGLWSEWEVLTFNVVSPPNKPSNLSVSTNPIYKEEIIDISWEDITDWGRIDGKKNYRLEYRYSNSEPFKFLGDSEVNSYEGFISINESANTVQYRVRAENEDTNSEWTESSLYDISGTRFIVSLETEYEILEDGFYHIAVQSGSGGGGGSLRYSKSHGNLYKRGLAGSSGSQYGGIVKLHKGDTLHMTVGHHGPSGSWGVLDEFDSTRGQAGGESYITLNNNYDKILSARGGNGGPSINSKGVVSSYRNPGLGENFIDGEYQSGAPSITNNQFAIRRVK